jgi:hypothetical protein
MGWAIATLPLDAVSAFVLALGLTAAFDQASGAVIAACLNDASSPHPSLALAQQLWDEPEAVLAIADLAHPLWRTGLLQPASTVSGGITWNTPLLVPPAVTTQLLFPTAPLPPGLHPLGFLPDPVLDLPARARLVAGRLKAQAAQSLRVVPVRGAGEHATSILLQGMAQITGRPIVTYQGVWTDQPGYLKSLATLCWLRGFDLFIAHQSMPPHCENHSQPSSEWLALQALPVTVYWGVEGRKDLSSLPSRWLLPLVEVPRLSYGDRLRHWQQALGTEDAALRAGLTECARRFRYEPETIQSICDGLQGLGQPPLLPDLLAACRAELDLDLGELAQEVIPRFTLEELILPSKQQVIFREIEQAMQALTQVHYGWGTARAWNECGIAVLFAGPPGTGKTMAAEILAARLDLPMYRIDLSQVVNKYIGETEKNLKRLFDAADVSDSILFFDEADALFGKRTEVKDAHDRYANLEISYLLERMERFKGLAILATNRKKDLDEAFLRRLRYIVDFPMPDIPERYRLWQQVIPEKVDATDLDFEFLSRQFSLAGGHIRSIVFNACLQTANQVGEGEDRNGARPKLTMARVITAVKREYDKLNRSVSLEQFGRYASVLEGAES